MAEDLNELSKVLIERDQEKAKAELEKFKSELTMMVADAKVSIGDAAVERMSAAIGLLYKSVGAALVTLAGLGGIGYITVSSSVKQVIDTKVNDWLSVESKNSIVKTTLEKIRMRVVLDSLVVRLAREKLDGRSDIYFSLSPIERAGLLAYMQEPETDLVDFRDCARIISASLGKFGVAYPIADMDQMLKSVMGSNDFQNEKRGILLESLKGYPGLYGYALQALQGTQTPASWRAAAFDVVALFHPKEAAIYAETNLLKEESDWFQQKMALSLLNQAASSSLDQWLSLRLKNDDGALSWILAADTVAPSRDFAPIEAEATVRARRSGKYLFTAIKNGARLANCAFSSATDLCFETRKSSYTISKPTDLFRNDIILSEVVKLAKEEKFDPAKLMSALTATGADHETYGIRADLGTATLMTENFGRVDSGTVRETVLLASGKRSGRGAEPAAVYVSFRAADGQWIHDVVIAYSDFYNSRLHFAFDESAMQAMEMRRFRKAQE